VIMKGFPTRRLTNRLAGRNQAPTTQLNTPLPEILYFQLQSS